MIEALQDRELCFPQLPNSSCRMPEQPEGWAVVVNILLFFISFLTAVLNLLVIISISHFRQLHTPTNLLLLSLAASDFLLGLLLTFQTFHIYSCWFLGDLLCVLYFLLIFALTSACIGTMVLISVDRYVAICQPLNYSNQITVRRVQTCTCICWSSPFLYNSFILSENLKHPGHFKSCTGECVVVISQFTGTVDFILTFISPITVIVVLYVRVFVVAVSQARAMRSHVGAQQSSVKVRVKKSEMKAARTLGVVVVVFLICLSPYFCATMSGEETQISPSSTAFIIFMFYFNSCLNPLIYAFFYPWFRKSVKLIVTMQILKPGSSNTNVL